MAHSTDYVTEELQEQILKDNGKKLLKKLKMTAMFITCLIREGAISDDEARDIQNLVKQSDQKQEMVRHLRDCKVEDFVSFCIVLHDEQERYDIVCDDFGLDIDSLKRQKEIFVQRRREKEESKREKKEYSTMTERPRHTGRPNDTEEGIDEVDEHIKNLLISGPEVPKSIPSLQEPAPSRQAAVAQGVEEVVMILDPTTETEIESNALSGGYQWMGTEIERLRTSVAGTGVKPVVIALLDSGVFEKHPDLKGLVIDRKNFTSDIGNEEEKDLTCDKSNHGTVSAGIIEQYAGKENVEILNLKVLKSDGIGALTHVTRALEYIKEWDKAHPDKTVDIILMTLGGLRRQDQTDRLLSELGENKILLCSAANDGQTKTNSIRSPANHGSVIAIGSCNKDGDRCSHSAVGQELDFLFPGEHIWSTSSKYHMLKGSSRYVMKTGTSFAAPHCAALVALVLSYVEVHCKMPGKDLRRYLTNSLRMKEFIRKELCGEPHSKERGFGIPQVDRVNTFRIAAFVADSFKKI